MATRRRAWQRVPGILASEGQAALSKQPDSRYPTTTQICPSLIEEELEGALQSFRNALGAA